MMRGMARRLANSAGGVLWENTSKFTDTGGGATDVVAIRLNKMDMMGTRVQLFVNNLPTHICMVVDRENICCFEDGSYKPQPAELEGLNLRNGRNSLRYELIHPCNNDKRFSVKADLHLWVPQDKIVVVDIDGTVTKTDVAGYGAAKLGYEYIHVGVCEVVTAISRQGYRILFLTSRAITLAQSTREFLRGIGFSNGGSGMPEFCLITTTETFLPSLMVGVRSADKFKTAALQEIVTAFAPEVKIRSSSEEKIPGWRMDTSPQMSHTYRSVMAAKGGYGAPSSPSGLPAQASSLPVTPQTPARVAERQGTEEDMNSQASTRGSDTEAAVAPAEGSSAVMSVEQAPSGQDPGGVFVCGIGNRLTDTAAYAAVGVPPSLNLLIDERSVLRTMDGGCQASFDGYLGLLPHIQRLLPALDSEGMPIPTGLGSKGICPFDCDCDLLVL